MGGSRLTPLYRGQNSILQWSHERAAFSWIALVTLKTGKGLEEVTQTNVCSGFLCVEYPFIALMSNLTWSGSAYYGLISAISGCEIWQMNPNVGQLCNLPDAGWRNLIVQLPGSNSRESIAIRVTLVWLGFMAYQPL